MILFNNNKYKMSLTLMIVIFTVTAVAAISIKLRDEIRIHREKNRRYKDIMNHYSL